MTKLEIMERIRRQMYITGYDEVRLASSCGERLGDMERILSGKRLPSPTLSDRIAELLGMDEQEMRAMLWDLNRKVA